MNIWIRYRQGNEHNLLASFMIKDISAYMDLKYYKYRWYLLSLTSGFRLLAGARCLVSEIKTSSKIEKMDKFEKPLENKHFSYINGGLHDTYMTRSIGGALTECPVGQRFSFFFQVSRIKKYSSAFWDDWWNAYEWVSLFFVLLQVALLAANDAKPNEAIFLSAKLISAFSLLLIWLRLYKSLRVITIFSELAVLLGE